MSLRDHALMEFRAAGWVNEDGVYTDEMQELICKDILAIVDLFASQGHSGSTAPYAINVLNKVLRFEPITPLTGEDWEWFDHGNGMFQNKRCSHVFKQPDRFNGQAYDLDAVVFREPSGACYTSSNSKRPITFPYTPHTEYVDVQANAGG